jgi:hypothetical protein
VRSLASPWRLQSKRVSWSGCLGSRWPESGQRRSPELDKYAQDIVEYRQTHGLFRRIEDLQNGPGVGPGILEENRNRIRVR